MSWILTKLGRIVGLYEKIVCAKFFVWGRKGGPFRGPQSLGVPAWPWNFREPYLGFWLSNLNDFGVKLRRIKSSFIWYTGQLCTIKLNKFFIFWQHLTFDLLLKCNFKTPHFWPKNWFVHAKLVYQKLEWDLKNETLESYHYCKLLQYVPPISHNSCIDCILHTILSMKNMNLAKLLTMISFECLFNDFGMNL